MNKIISMLMVLAFGATAQAEPARLAAQLKLDHIRAQVIAQPPPFERRGHLARAMKSLGPDALEPLITLVEDPQLLQKAAPRARLMLLASAAEALGAIGNRRAVPVLRNLFEGQQDAAVLKVAAEALGRFDSDEDAAWLASRAVAGHPKELAALSGLGFVRRPLAVSHLAGRLAALPAPAATEVIAEAMGFSGSSWAWIALGPERQAEGIALREELSAALAAAYPRYTDGARLAIGRALLMIEAPSTPNRLAQLRQGAPASLAADVQALERRWLRVRSH